MKKPATWERPKTTKVYLHPPYTERMVTMWPDFKVVSAGHVDDGRSTGFNAIGFIVLLGQALEQIPWEKAVYETTGDGIPVHRITYSGEITVSLEAFCGFGRNPAAYCRLVLRNSSNFMVRDTFSILPRSGNECYLMGINIDGYCSYDPDVNLWHMLPATWKREGNTLTDGTAGISVKTGEGLSPLWVDCRKAEPFRQLRFLEFAYALEPGEEVVLELSLANSAPADFDYEREKAACVRQWGEILSGIKLFPQTDVPHYRAMFLHLVSQCLQMLARYVGSDDVIPRQGCIARHIWPYEAAEYLTQLDRIGLARYTDGAYRYFMDKYVQHDGPDKGRVRTSGLQWMNMTGSVVWGMSQHLLCLGDREEFDEYKDTLYDCFQWIQRTRVQTSAPGSGYRYRGIFPAGRSCDWDDSIQDWCFTDAQNLMGYRELYWLYERFRDARSAEVGAACGEYESALKAILDELTAGTEGDDEIALPYRLGEALSDPPNWPYFAVGPVFLIRAGVIEPGSRVFRQLENYFRNRGQMKNGLTGLMDCSQLTFVMTDGWPGHTWYTTLSDRTWLNAWLASGEFDKAEECFAALTKYAMTKEFYVNERYADNDPTFTPWQPNGSGSGRMIDVMLNYFEHRARVPERKPYDKTVR